MPAFLVSKFSKQAISNLVKECFGSEFPDVYSKKQTDYLFRYLQDLKAQSIVLEAEYVDKDFLDDHSRFYVRRFNNRGHGCARLHFFSLGIDVLDFDRLLGHGTSEKDRQNLQFHYLGFMVVKPLPKTFIGKTCFKLYESLNGGPQKACLSRTYTVHLFGIGLTVKSVAFQEQDKVISACATTAIWSAFNALQWIPIRAIPSCCDITTNAINFIADSSNSFPNRELSVKQILRAIDVQGLRHHSYSVDCSQSEVFPYIESHIRSGLPLVLVADVYQIVAEKKLTRLAGHALTIVGYARDAGRDVLYVHDDRLGPFARATFAKAEDYHSNAETTKTWVLLLQEKDDRGVWREPHQVLIPSILIAITDKKARLPLDPILHTCYLIQKSYLDGVKALTEGAKESNISKLDFKIAMVEASDFKRRILEGEDPGSAHDSLTGTSDLSLTEAQQRRISILTQSFARLQWEAEFSFAGSKAFTVLFDATDIPQGDAVSAIYATNQKSMDAITAAIGAVGAFADTEVKPPDTFLTSFIRRLKPAKRGLQDHLDKTYGAPRAPRYLKEQEVQDSDTVENKKVRHFYEPSDKTLEGEFPSLKVDDKDSYMIWVIDLEGTLLIGEEIDSVGHPSMTGYKPARIAGELKRTTVGWSINSKSGRYGANYSNRDKLLQNALRRFKSMFPESRNTIAIELASDE
jgi:hypothetical protein